MLIKINMTNNNRIELNRIKCFKVVVVVVVVCSSKKYYRN